MKDLDSRYRMTSQNLLPKFGSDKNPFCNMPKTEPVRIESVKAQAGAAELPKAEPAPLVAGPLFEIKPKEFKPMIMISETKPVAAPSGKAELKPAEAAPSMVVPAGKSPVRPGNWLKKLNPFSYLPIRKSGERAIEVRPAKTHIQTELSLEKVTVMRNDLSDTDLAVVRTKPVELPKTPLPILQPMVVKSEPTTWGRLTSRIFGSEQTQIR
jgi:hypothetical protein